MDDRKHSLSPQDLYARLGSGAGPIVVEVRRENDFANDDRLIVRAFRGSPEQVEEWRRLEAETHNWPARTVGA